MVFVKPRALLSICEKLILSYQTGAHSTQTHLGCQVPMAALSAEMPLGLDWMLEKP